MASASNPPISSNSKVIQSITWQAEYAAKNGAPITGRVVRAQLVLLDGATQVGQRLAAWPDTAPRMRCRCG